MMMIIIIARPFLVSFFRAAAKGETTTATKSRRRTKREKREWGSSVTARPWVVTENSSHSTSSSSVDWAISRRAGLRWNVTNDGMAHPPIDHLLL